MHYLKLLNNPYFSHVLFYDCSIFYDKQYIKTSLPQAEEDESVVFEFENEEDQIELIIGDNPPNGWSIHPHKRPVKVHVNNAHFAKQINVIYDLGT